MYHVYVLISQKNKRLYIGLSANINARLKAHNAGDVQSTRPYRPYQLILVEQYETITLARQRESQIKKSGRIRKELKQLTASSSNG